MEWSIQIEAAAPDGPADEPTDEAIEKFTNTMGAHAGACAIGERSYEAMFALDGDDPIEVTRRGARTFIEAAADAGLSTDWPIVRLNVRTWDVFEDDEERAQFPELVGIGELKELLAVNSRQRAHRVTQNADFPRPVATLKMGPVWTRDQIAGFVDQWKHGMQVPALPKLDLPKLPTLPKVVWPEEFEEQVRRMSETTRLLAEKIEEQVLSRQKALSDALEPTWDRGDYERAIIAELERSLEDA